MSTYNEHAECGSLPRYLKQLGDELERFLRFDHGDAMDEPELWQNALRGPLPEQGTGIGPVMDTISRYLIPNGSKIPHPGFSSFITTGPTTLGALTSFAASIAAPQRLGLTAFQFLEEQSLQWLGELLSLPPHMKGIYSSGGSVANLLALGAARQWAFEQIGIDPALDGVSKPARIYATASSHHTIHRSAAVLGLGRNAVVAVKEDRDGRMCADDLQRQLVKDASRHHLPIAIVATAGTTGAGAIDPLRQLGDIARAHKIWFHVDGAYGLPGILDPQVTALYDGLELADSVVIDPHKWLGAPIGIGTTFVRDRDILHRAFTQGAADYLEGTISDEQAQSSLDGLGIPYADFGVELSSPPRGAVVWALIKEIGKAGMRERVCRHNAMARRIAERARAHPKLELVREPTLSICCFRYVSANIEDLNAFNRRIHRQLLRNGENMPSTTLIDGALVIRPCFIGARTLEHHAEALVDEVLAIGERLNKH
ncbi:MAG: aminotransferase class V-fold PLP-dependent enzyme [Gammaproteobacteria bacterium]|nr:aminotransferase class V-fold PLP-dependent enzyme [Gammaproteobacteria bacterium]MBQ0839352.1 aminotransferase class V-fold PLP-dependent enzyme [Gammaproteobacteria bacterium]